MVWGKWLANFWRRRDTREKRNEPSKRGKLSTTKLESSREAHIQGKRIPIRLETPLKHLFLGHWVGFKRFPIVGNSTPLKTSKLGARLKNSSSILGLTPQFPPPQTALSNIVTNLHKGNFFLLILTQAKYWQIYRTFFGYSFYQQISWTINI